MATSVSTPCRAKMSTGSRARVVRRKDPCRGKANMNQQAGKNVGVLWVDAVGAFLVTTSDDVVLGQARPDKAADVMIQADISGRHACVRRDVEDYVVEPLAVVYVNGRPIVTATTLADGDLIGLGGNVQIRFRKPHPFSNSARLEVTTGQRLEPAVDAVILMGETCLFGPQPNNHVSCAHWERSLVLSRAESEDFRFRAGERVEIDGSMAGDKGDIAWGSRMTGKNFAITFERM